MDPDQKVIFSLVEGFVGGERRGISLREAFELRDRELISLVGAGGKTTLMFRLARELKASGKRVVTTTTTKIREPSEEETEGLCVESDVEKLREFLIGHLGPSRHITLASERLGGGKLKGLSPETIHTLWHLNRADYIVVEADGAAGRPVKAPREKEPVIPAETTLVIAIMGMDGVGTALDEAHAFQPERISKLTGVRLGGKLDEEAVAVLMTHPEGIWKGAPSTSRVVAFLNKVDLPNALEKARSLAREILKRGARIERIILGQLEKEPSVLEIRGAGFGCV